MRRSCFLYSTAFHIAAVAAMAVTVGWHTVYEESWFEIRIDHQEAARFARPLPRPRTRTPVELIVEEHEASLELSPEVLSRAPDPEETFGLPLRSEPQPGFERFDHRTASDDRTFDVEQPIAQRIVFDDRLGTDEVEPEETTELPDPIDETETEEDAPAGETSDSRSGASARLRGRVRAPSYPERAIQRRWEGDVIVDFGIGTGGDVTDAFAVEELSVRYGLLKRSAERAVRTWKFDPATRDGRAIASRLRVRIRFRLRGGVNVDVDEWDQHERGPDQQDRAPRDGERSHVIDT